MYRSYRETKCAPSKAAAFYLSRASWLVPAAAATVSTLLTMSCAAVHCVLLQPVGSPGEATIGSDRRLRKGRA